MTDYISKEDFIKSCCNECDGWCNCVECDCLNCCEPSHRCDMIANLVDFPAADVVERASGIIGVIPAADVRPVVHGHNTGKARIFECSECGYGFSDIFLTNEHDYPIVPNYCPNCGAMMEES